MRTRNRRFSVWFDDKEFNHLTKQAEIAGLKKEQFIRKAIMGKTIRPRPPDEYYKILKEINSIGCNVNQIARIANSERHIMSRDINRVAAMVDEIMSIVRKWN